MRFFAAVLACVLAAGISLGTSTEATRADGVAPTSQGLATVVLAKAPTDDAKNNDATPHEDKKADKPAAKKAAADQAGTKQTKTAKKDAEKPTGAKATDAPKEPAKKEAAPKKSSKKEAPDSEAAAKPKTDAKKQKEAGPQKKEKEKKEATLVVFTIKGPYPEKPSPPGPFGDMQPSLRKVIQRLDEAAKDDDVDAVLLRIELGTLGPGSIHEIRHAIHRVQQADKPVYAEMESGMGTQYMVAVACDHVAMPPSGMLSLTGVRAEVTFYKGLLDKLGVEAEFLQMGKYKGAGEPYSRTEMSQPLRESFEAVVDSLYETLVQAVADGRGMEDYRVKTLIDEGFFTAAAAKKADLIDQVAYRDQVQSTIKKALRADELEVVTQYRKKKVDVDFSGFSGMMKLMELMFGGGRKQEEKKQGKKIAVVYAEGMIVPGKPSRGLFGSEAIGSASMVKTLQTAADDEDVAAIVLRVNSPGGSAVASDVIWREIVNIEKPVIASMGNVAASGGYYIAMGADKIVASPGTITGSIGVIGGKLVVGGLYDKLGLSTEVISRGKMNEVFSVVEPFSPEERATLMRMLKAIYHDFVSKAAKGRDMKFDKMEKLAQGRIYTGSMAASNGLIDRVGSLQDAIDEAKKAAGLKPDEEVELLILPRPKTFLEELFNTSDVASPVAQALGPWASQLGHVELWRDLLQQPTLTVLPYHVEVK